MTQPTRVDIDLTNRLGYVYYTDENMRTNDVRHVSDVVRAAFLANGDLYGIELQALDEGTIAAAAGYANSIGAAFPSGLDQVA